VSIKGVNDIKFDIRTVRSWVTRAIASLDWVEYLDFDRTKRELQEAKKLIDEAVVDLDGLIQDQKGTDATRS